MSENAKWVKLTCLSGEIEADLLYGLLENNEIPAVKMYPGNTQIMKIYMGTAIGVEIHVPEDMLNSAKEILKELENTLDIDEELNDECGNS